MTDSKDDTSILTVENLECVRGDRLLFTNLSFELESGQLLHIEGANGCGKTSLLRILCGLGQPETGEVLWRGKPIQKARRSFFEELAYLGHHPGIKGELTPLENLQLVTHLHRIHPCAEPLSILAQAGLAKHADEPARMLSAGQRQRIALARLLLQQASLWILDEPFTALDVNGVAWVQSLLDEHLKQRGLVILTSHQKVETRCPVTKLRLGR